MTWTVVGHEDFEDEPDAVDIVVIVSSEYHEEVGPADPGGFGPPPRDDEQPRA